MAPSRRKCILNPGLAKKYPFMKKTKSESDVQCEICNSEFNIGNAGRSDIEKHLTTDKHKKALNAKSISNPVTNFFPSTINYTISACEGVWAYHVIKENHSFRSSDCASKIFRTCFELKNYHCGRTKCEAIAKNVLASFSESELRTELAKATFVTILTDASNHGNVKIMSVNVRYFIPTAGVRVKLLNFFSQKGETSQIITSLVTSIAERFEIHNKIVGFCADNCRTNFGSCERGGENNVFFFVCHNGSRR